MVPAAGESAGHQAVRESCSVHSIDFLYILLLSIVVINVRFLCCSVKLPISRPMSFTFFFPFSSTPHQAEGQQSDRLVLGWQPGLVHNTVIFYQQKPSKVSDELFLKGILHKSICIRKQ